MYFDNSATTQLDQRVLDAMIPYFTTKYAVATSEFAYTMGLEAAEALKKARQTIATTLSAQAEEIIFTSGSTESSNMAVKGVARQRAKKGNHLITSTIEDFPVLNSMKALEREGFKVDYISVDEEGFVNLQELENAITSETQLVSIQYANQEIGTIQPIRKIAELCREKGVLFHTDATHAYMRLPLDVNVIPADLITLSAHTLHGPRGVGAQYIRKGTKLRKLMDGGFHEFNIRPGVENIPLIVGFAKAVELITHEETRHLQHLRNKLIKELSEKISHVQLNGSADARLPQNANITFRYIEGESLTLHLDMRGVAVSTGSACFSKSLEASHVIMGIGGNHERAHGSLRFTLGRFNTEKEIDELIAALTEIVPRLREISPLGQQIEEET